MATSLNHLAILYNHQGKHAEAESLFKRALTIREKSLGPEHPKVAATLENYAALLWAMERPEEAEQFAARAKAIRSKQGS